MRAALRRPKNKLNGRHGSSKASSSPRSFWLVRAAKKLLTETTRYTNMQNAVGEKDFIALEEDFRTWAPAFNKRFGVFLKIQRGAWEGRRAYQKQNPTATPHYSEFANAFDLLKAYAAAGWSSRVLPS